MGELARNGVQTAGATPGNLWCLHGAVGEAADWRGVGLGDTWPLRFVDLWRFLACRPMSLAETAGALNAEAAAAGGRHVLLGYSLGGRLALHALLEHGHPWQAAVIVAAHPGLEDDAERRARREADAAWAAAALADWERFVDEWQAQPVLAGTACFDRNRLKRRRREVARSFVEWSLGGQASLWQRLGEIEVPVLWVTGERDTKFTALGRRAVNALPRGRHWLAEAAGHRVPWEVPGPFAARVAEFLEQSAG